MNNPNASPQPARRRWILAIGLTALLPIAAFAVFALFQAVDAFRISDEARLRNTASALAVAVDAQLQGSIIALETLATSTLLTDPVDSAAFEERARAVGTRLGGWVVLVDPPPGYQMRANTLRAPGTTLGSALPPGSEEALLPALERVFTEGRSVVSDMFVGAVARQPVLAVMVPVDRPDQPRRVLAAAFELGALRGLLARQQLPDGTFAAIADGQLRIMAHTRDPEGRQVGVAAPAWVASAIEGTASALIVGPGWAGRDNVYAVERLTLAPGWTVTVAEPQHMQQATAWASLRGLVAGGASLGIGIALIVWANRREAVRDAHREAEALRAGRADVERLHGGLPAIIFLREMAPDGSSRLVYRGGDLEGVMGWPTELAATRDNFDDMVHPGDAQFGDHGPRLLQDGQISYEWRIRQPADGWRTLHTLARVLERRPDGGAEIVGYTVDITLRREAEARAVAASRLASLGEMAAGLAHEIKQPLQTITLAAEIAQIAAREGNAADVNRRLERIIAQTHRTAEIIDRLRRFARGAEDESSLEAVRLADVVEDCLELMRSALRDASITVEVTLGDPPPLVRGQALLLEQVLSNLLLNARDALAARPTDATRRIRISAGPGTSGMVQLKVADTGGGIATQVMARLFEPFVTTKSADCGTGLGLSICHGLIKGMAGTIEAHNDADGAVFTITLPEAVAADPQNSDARRG